MTLDIEVSQDLFNIPHHIIGNESLSGENPNVF
jgi:hypothetical protein